MGDFDKTSAYIAGSGLLGAKIVQMSETVAAEQAAKDQIQLEQEQRTLQLTQKKMSVYTAMQTTLEKQEAQATTRGITMDSPSFNAIQRDTLNIGSKNLKNVTTQEEFVKYSSDIEKENVHRATQAKLFGEATDLGMSFAKLAAL